MSSCSRTPRTHTQPDEHSRKRSTGGARVKTGGEQRHHETPDKVAANWRPALIAMHASPPPKPVHARSRRRDCREVRMECTPVNRLGEAIADLSGAPCRPQVAERNNAGAMVEATIRMDEPQPAHGADERGSAHQ